MYGNTKDLEKPELHWKEKRGPEEPGSLISRTTTTKLQSLWPGHESSNRAQWNPIESPEITPSPMANSSMTKEARWFSGATIAPSTNGAGKTGHLHAREWNYRIVWPHTKLKLQREWRPKCESRLSTTPGGKHRQKALWHNSQQQLACSTFLNKARKDTTKPMGPKEAQNLLHGKGHRSTNKKTTGSMGENFCKWPKQQRFTLQNMQTTPTTPQQPQQNKPFKTWAEDLKRHLTKEDM